MLRASLNKIFYSVSARLVHSGRQNNRTSGADILTFGTRSGTRNGVETHIFRVETQRDLAYWSRALVQGAHGAASVVKEVSSRTCRERSVKLFSFFSRLTMLGVSLSLSLSIFSLSFSFLSLTFLSRIKCVECIVN